MKLRLSRLIPVPMRSTYGVISDPLDPARDGTTEHASWWQFRGHIFGHRRAIA